MTAPSTLVRPVNTASPASLFLTHYDCGYKPTAAILARRMALEMSDDEDDDDADDGQWDEGEGDWDD